VTRDPDRLTPEEVQAEAGAELPDKEAMSLLDLNADLDLALDIAAPIDAAVAANANVAANIDGAVAANVVSFDSAAVATADQDSIVQQNLVGEATATANQDATIDQGGA
jgi:hypothetical protein